MSIYKKTFKESFPFDKRRAEATRIREKFSDRIPIIVERAKGVTDANMPQMGKRKYLVPSDLTVGQFQHIIRMKASLRAEQALFLFSNGSIPSPHMLVSQLYKEQESTVHDWDGFIYIEYSGENTFG